MCSQVGRLAGGGERWVVGGAGAVASDHRSVAGVPGDIRRRSGSSCRHASTGIAGLGRRGERVPHRGGDPEPLGQIHVARGRWAEGQSGGRELQLTGRLGAGNGRIGRRDCRCRLTGRQPHHAGGLTCRTSNGTGVEVPGTGLGRTGRRRSPVLARELRRIGHVVGTRRHGDRGRTSATGRCASTSTARTSARGAWHPTTATDGAPVIRAGTPTSHHSPGFAGRCNDQQGQTCQSRGKTACLRPQHLGTVVVLNEATFQVPPTSTRSQVPLA